MPKAGTAIEAATVKARAIDTNFFMMILLKILI